VQKIRILPETVSNKIAAGEVIERPASVVKELLENALDAGSSRILVEVVKGGRALIRVSDNGLGMGKDDALLSLERYATSKIRTDKDLFFIKTLGFRGEALPSIASVSRFTLITSDNTAGSGTEITVEGGKIQRVAGIGAPMGTLVTVQDLFFNVPARRKFMKSLPTEMGHIVDVLDRAALGHPHVAMTLTGDGRSIRSYVPEDREKSRVMEIFGKDLSGGLHEIRHSVSDLEITGWVVSPEETRKTGRWIFLYVNGRFVRDRVLQHAVMEGFRGRLVKGAFPMAMIKIRIPEDRVDVNVHPTKSEVRFSQSQWIHDQVAGAVAKALEGRERHFIKKMGRPSFSGTFEIREPAPEFSAPPREIPREKPKPPALQAPLWEVPDAEFLRVIGQFRSTYIVCESREGLLLIDQHAAHERILFERMQRADRPASQRLLVAETLEIGFREAEILEKMLPELNVLGVEIDLFGDHAFIITSVPAILSGKPLQPLIRELVDKAAETGISENFEKNIDHCRAVIACHAAVRAGQVLSREAMESMILELHACKNPAHCPHGRPAYVQWTDAFLEKAFFRTV